MTIGVGHNLDANGLCDEAILAQLKHDINKSRESARRVCRSFFDHLDPVRQDVLVLMVFQLGEKGFAAFAPTLALIEAGKYAAAADRILKSKWAKQTPKRVYRLVKMLEHGEYIYG